MNAKKSEILLNLWIVVISLLAALVIAEVFIRVKWTNYWKNYNRSIILRELVPNDKRVYSRKNLFAQGGYVTVRTDEDGFMLPDFIDKGTSKVMTIAFLGASTTECFWVDEALRFPYLTSKEVADTYNISTRVLNSGGSSNTSHHSLNVLLNKVINYNPDIVLMLHAVNDATLLMGTGNYKPAMIEEKDMSLFDWASRKSSLIGFLRHIRAQYLINKGHRKIARGLMEKKDARSYQTEDTASLEKALAQFAVRLKIFVDVTRDMGAVPVLVTQPYYQKIQYQLTEEGRKTSLAGINYMDKFNEQIRETAKLKECALIDLAGELDQDAKYFYDHLHYSEEGSRKVAGLIFKHLQEIVPSILREGNK
ncbi:MAG: SGNH/GDSL hydrolase family protein [Candidatus Omnitrophota bacterium]